LITRLLALAFFALFMGFGNRKPMSCVKAVRMRCFLNQGNINAVERTAYGRDDIGGNR
jgi:hypothetical protein